MLNLLLSIVCVALYALAFILAGALAQYILVAEEYLDESLSLRRRIATGAIMVVEAVWLGFGTLALAVWLSDVFDLFVVAMGWELIGPAGIASLLLAFFLGVGLGVFGAKLVFCATLYLANKGKKAL